MKNLKFLLFLNIACLVLFNSCKDDDPIIENDEEVITTLNYTLTPTTGDVVTLSFLDLDGEGGTAPTVTGGTLQANMTYTGSIELKNESESPADDITAEVLEEADEHQFFFSTSTDLDLSVSYSDEDPLGNPVGLSTSLTTGAASSGTFTVMLQHKPEKTATGVSGGDPTNAGGETDIEVTFDITIQ